MTSAAPSVEPALPVPVLAILLPAFAAFASGVSMRLTDPLLPQLALEFGVTLSAASYVVTAFSIAYGVSQLFFGPLGDRYGKYRVIGWACCSLAARRCSCAASGNRAWRPGARACCHCL